MTIETQQITFTSLDGFSKNITFGTAFYSAPSISASPEAQNIEVFVTNLTTSGCTLNTSAPFAGTISLIAVGS
jgi:hypothetical protein